ncbi:MAG TPA: TetR/AcrR family transcriptional regulator [Anaerolineales bacterium]|nr:TetR/AcrR family transcriptional regulator [Anaerolineales bacterium]
MTHKPADPRTQRTDTLLQDSLIELTAERGFDAVTVGDIAKHAKVNRATFYRHYQDKYDLVEKIFQQAIHVLRSELGPPGGEALNTDPQNPPERWVRLFEHFLENERLYRALLGSHGSSWFVARMRDQINELVEEREQLRDDIAAQKKKPRQTKMPMKVAITLVSTLFVHTVAWWLEYGRAYSPEQMAGWFLELVVNGYLDALGL